MKFILCVVLFFIAKFNDQKWRLFWKQKKMRFQSEDVNKKNETIYNVTVCSLPNKAWQRNKQVHTAFLFFGHFERK